jgi:LEA14-like dessication related protein
MRDRPSRLRALTCAAVFFASLLSGGCAPHFERPDVAVVGVELKSLQLLEQQFVVRVRVKNPNALSIPLEGLSYKLSLNGEDFAHGDSDESVTVPAHGEATVGLPVTTSLHSGVPKLLQQFAQGNRSVDYHVVGNVRTGVPLHRNLPFDTQGTIALPRN